MLKCIEECPVNGSTGTCCWVCPQNASCAHVCNRNPEDCGSTLMEVDNEEVALAVFQSQQATVLNSIADLIQAKKDIESKEADLKVQLQKAMETYGIKKFTSDILDITYVAATTAESIDSTKLKAKYPQIAAECVTFSNRKAYIKVSLKGGK